MSVNKVILLGNVGKDPEVTTFDGGAKKASFTLATSEKYTDRNSEVKEKTQWHNIICWRKTADVVERYVKKGTQMYVEGKITYRSWQDKDGQTKYITEIEAMNIQLLGARTQPSPSAVAETSGQAPSPTTYTQEELAPHDDDLPF